MNPFRLPGWFAVAVLFLAVNVSPVRADDASGPASLEDVHNILKQAAGDSADTAPAPDQQKDLVGQAIRMIRHLPHVYHGQLNRAAADLEAAVDELTGGDSVKARHDILDADDIIRGIM